MPIRSTLGEISSVKIWVTGGSGSLGQELIKKLELGNHGPILLVPTRKELDLTNKNAVREYVASHKPTHVFHLAAKVFGIGGHKENPDASMLENTSIDFAVFSALLEYPPQWVYYSSTVAAYGYPYQSLPLVEKDWLVGNPHASELGYSMSKREGLDYLEKLHTLFETKYVYGLCTNLFGSGDRFLEGRGHVIISLLEKAAKIYKSQVPLEVWGDGTASRDFLSTQAASTILTDLMNKHVGIVNIASGLELSIEEIADKIAIEFGILEGIKFIGINQGVTRRVCSIEKLNNYIDSTKIESPKEDLWREIARYRTSQFAN